MTKKILVIEDEPEIQEILMDRAAFHNLECEIAGTGEEGLERLRKTKPDVILLDLMLPKMSGLGVLREIKKDAKLQKIPVVVLTALSQEKVARECMDLGAKAYFSKTGNMNDLFQLLQEYLQS